MSTKRKTKSIWQHPFVNVFKQFEIEKWKKVKREGDVVTVMDKKIKSTVVKVQGSVPAGNYIQIPRTNGQSLGLTGRYFYVSFKPIPSKYFVVHLDVVDDDNFVVRISFSNLFKEFRSTSTWLQFPFACSPAKGSVEECTSRGVKKTLVGPAPLSQKWTLLVLDLRYILSTYTNKNYSHMKSMRFCANMLLKNCFTSDIQYDPRISPQQARSLGITNTSENFAPLPREISFFLPKDKAWDDLYDVVHFPVDNLTLKLPFDTIQSNQQQILLIEEKKKRKKPENVVVDIRKTKSAVNAGYKTSDQITPNIAVQIEKEVKWKPKGSITQDLPYVGLKEESEDDEEILKEISDDASVHVFMKSPNNKDIINGLPLKSICKEDLVDESINKSNIIRKISSLKNSSIQLFKVIGFGNHTFSNEFRKFRSLALWHPRSSNEDSVHVVVYAVQALVVAMETVTRKQRVFVGHTDKVTCISLNQYSGNQQIILASGQTGPGGVVRVWNFDKTSCICVIKSTFASSMDIVTFSRTGGVLVGSGKDHYGKTVFVVWDTSSILKTKTFSVIAKAHSNVEINRICISPVHDMRIVTCGRDNIRFWRVKSNQIRSCPISTSNNHQSLSEVSDVTFAPPGCLGVNEDDEKINPFNVFACTRKGLVFEIDFTSLNIRNCYHLNSKLKKQSRGLILNTLRIQSTYLLTGSEDGFLRFWPLNLKSVFLEAEHDSSVTDVDVSADTSKVLVTTASGTLGYLDISTRHYTTLMRSHIDRINDCSFDLLRDIVVTCSDDFSIHLTQVNPLQQIYNFGTPNDKPSCVSCHPSLQIFAVGFFSGCVRIFDCDSTSVVSEHPSAHDGHQVISILFTSSGNRLISRCKQGTLCLYDTSQALRFGVPLLRKLVQAACPGLWYGPNSLNASVDGLKCAYIGANQLTITIATTDMLDELLRVDVTTDSQQDLLLRPRSDIPKLVVFSPLNHLIVITCLNRLLKIDSETGSLLQIVANIHKKSSTSVCVSKDARFLVTSGDNEIKIWDYKMSDHNSFQVFKGHCDKVHQLHVTDDEKLISSGSDAVIIWNLKPQNESSSQVLFPSGRHEINIERKDDEEDVDDCSTVLDDPQSSPRVHFVDMDSPNRPDTLHASDLDTSVSDFTYDAKLIEEMIKDEVSEDRFDSDPVVQSTLVSQMNPKIYEDTIQPDNQVCNHSDHLEKVHEIESSVGSHEKKIESSEDLYEMNIKSSESLEIESSPFDPLQIVPEKQLAECKANDTLDISDLHLEPKESQQPSISCAPIRSGCSPKKKIKNKSRKVSFRKVATKNPQIGICDVWKEEKSSEATKIKEVDPIYPSSDLPEALSYYKPRHDPSKQATKTYTAPQNQQGLQLHQVLGYNGNSRSNLIWSSSMGILLYTCGCTVVVERLDVIQKRYLFGHTEEVSCLALQNNNQVFVSVSGRNEMVACKICFWDMDTLKELTTIEVDSNEIISMSFSPNDKYLLTISDHLDKTVSIWTTYDGRTLPQLLTNTSIQTPIIQSCWNEFSTNFEFATVGTETSLIFWFLDLSERNNKNIMKLNVPEIPISLKQHRKTATTNSFTSICYGSSDLCYIGSQDGMVSVWSTSYNCCLIYWLADPKEICIIRSSDQFLLTGGSSGILNLWKIHEMIGSHQKGDVMKFEGKKIEKQMIVVNEKITSASFTSTLDMGVIGTTQGSIFHIDWNKKFMTSLVSSHSTKINDLAFDSESRFFATCSDSGSIRIWSTDHFQQAGIIKGPNIRCTCVSFFPSTAANYKNLLVAAFVDGSLRIYNIRKLTEETQLKPHRVEITSIRFSIDATKLFTASINGNVAITDLTSYQSQMISTKHHSPITNIDVSSLKDRDVVDNFLPDLTQTNPGRCLFTAKNHRVSVWSTEWEYDTCVLVDWLTFSAPKYGPDGVKYNPRSKCGVGLPPNISYFHPTNPDLLIYTGYGLKKLLHHYSLSRKKIIKSVEIPDWAVSMKLTSDGKIAAIGTSSRLLQLVDVEFGTFQDYSGHLAPIHLMSFSPDMKYLITISTLGDIFAWMLRLDVAMET